MEQYNIKRKLEEFEELERVNQIDYFRFIAENVRVYKEKYGEDEWISTFVSEYLHDRHNRKVFKGK